MKVILNNPRKNCWQDKISNLYQIEIQTIKENSLIDIQTKPFIFTPSDLFHKIRLKTLMLNTEHENTEHQFKFNQSLYISGI